MISRDCTIAFFKNNNSKDLKVSGLTLYIILFNLFKMESNSPINVDLDAFTGSIRIDINEKKIGYGLL